MRNTQEEANVSRGIFLRRLSKRNGALVYANFVVAPSSTKNQERACAHEMKRKECTPWYFRLKAHIGVDDASVLVHTAIPTAWNVSDISKMGDQLHGQEELAGADIGFVIVKKCEDMKVQLAMNEQSVKWHVAKRRQSIQKMKDGWQEGFAQASEKLKAKYFR